MAADEGTGADTGGVAGIPSGVVGVLLAMFVVGFMLLVDADEGSTLQKVVGGTLIIGVAATAVAWMIGALPVSR